MKQKKYWIAAVWLAGAAVIMVLVWGLRIKPGRDRERIGEIFGMLAPIQKCTIVRLGENFNTAKRWEDPSPAEKDVSVEVEPGRIGPFTERIGELVKANYTAFQPGSAYEMRLEYTIVYGKRPHENTLSFIDIKTVKDIQNERKGILEYELDAEEDNHGAILLDGETAKMIEAIINEEMAGNAKKESTSK